MLKKQKSAHKGKTQIRRQALQRVPASLLRKRTIEVTRTAASLAKRQKTLHSEKIEDVDADEPVELDERTTQILEDELQAVMIKVWQSLPDSPHSPAERHVIERLRNEASDDIRNVLGLNVTKRLLNVFNPLFLRVHFSRTPESVHLRQFMKNYNIKEFKQHQQHRNLYVARVRNIADFDRLVTARNQKCGVAKITIKPSYRFSQCPAKLNTVFAKKNNADTDKKDNENTEDVKQESSKQASSNDKDFKKPAASSSQETVISENNQPSKTIVESDKNKVTVQNETSIKNRDESVKSSQSHITKPKTNQVTIAKQVTAPTKELQPSQQMATKKVTESTKTTEKTTTTNIKANLHQDKKIESTKKDIEASPKMTPKLTPTTSIKPNSNQVNENIGNNVKKVTPKSTEKPVAQTISKPQPNQINQGVTTKVTETTPKSNEKSVTPNNIKPNVTTNKVNATTPKSSENTVTASKLNEVKQEVVTIKKDVAGKATSVEKPSIPANVNPKSNQENRNVATNKPTPTPVKNVPTPIKNEPMPVKNVPTPVKNEPMPVKNVPTPVKNVPTPVKNVPTPVKNVPTPVKKVPTPVKNVPTPVKNLAAPVKNVTKPKPKEVVANKKKLVDSITAESFDETDEMDDEEILALISTGIVVDECSGSDEE